jgi:arginyl-tRNA synthetase
MKASEFNISQLLTPFIIQGVKDVFGHDISSDTLQFQKTRKEFIGDITLVVFPLVKLSKLGPEQTGEQLGAYLQANSPLVSGYQVVKGFLNVSIQQEQWIAFLQACLKDAHYGLSPQNSKPHIMVEYSSPNTNKPLHLGHLRNNFLGYSVATILQANGHRVTKVQIINDRGIHICKSMIAWQQFGQGETPESTGMKGDHLVGKYYVVFDREHKAQMQVLIGNGMTEEEAAQSTEIMRGAQDMLRKWEAKDEATIALWNTMNGWVYQGFEMTYKAMGVDFDKLYYESNTYLNGKEEVDKGLASGVFFQKPDGSVWIDLTEDGLDQKAVLRKDGTAMYITQDIGTAILRFQDYPDLQSQIYTVGNEQEYHFKVLFKILEKLGFPQAQQCHHLSYGMVELPEGKMKSREGTVVDADDLIAEMAQVAKEVADEQGKLEGLPDSEKAELHHTIGMAALKYFLLRVDPKKNMVFDPKESIDFNGQTGPSIQYSYVRTRAILRKHEEAHGSGADLSDTIAPTCNIDPAELDVIRALYQWPDVLKEAAKNFDPSSIAHYCYDLAKTFNAFYQDHPILREENPSLKALRIGLTQATGRTLRTAMNLLGISMPERM